MQNKKQGFTYQRLNYEKQIKKSNYRGTLREATKHEPEGKIHQPRGEEGQTISKKREGWIDLLGEEQEDKVNYRTEQEGEIKPQDEGWIKQQEQKETAGPDVSRRDAYLHETLCHHHHDFSA